MAPRCILHRVFTAPNLAVRGYADDGRYEVPDGGSVIIGRTQRAAITIPAVIGGHRTYVLGWREPSWWFKANNEWAIAKIDGESLKGLGFHRRAVKDQALIEIFDVRESLVHSFRIEIAEG